MSDRESDMERVKAACEALGEHYDSVQIFVTRHEPEVEDGTVNIEWSSGNWFARFGQIREWLIKAEERTRIHVRRDEES